MNHSNETSLFNAGDTSIRINSENDQQSQNQQQPDMRINEATSSPQHTINIDVNAPAHSESSTVQQNLLSFLHGARNHLGGRPTSLPTGTAEHVHHHHHHQHTEDSNVYRWGMNLNHVLSFSAGPSADTIRSWIPRNGNFRYVPVRRVSVTNAAREAPAAEPNSATTSQDVVINVGTIGPSTSGDRSESSSSTTSRDSRTSNSARISLSRTNSIGYAIASTASGDNSAATNPDHGTPLSQISNSSGGHRTPSTPPLRVGDLDEDSMVYELAVKILSHFVRYLPFICIILIKSIFDHWLGILDIIILHTVIYQVDKSLCEQIAKLSQKSFGVLLRDYLLVTFVIVYRFMLAQSRPDPFGLLLNTADDPHSLSQLLYAVAVNDLILKLITIKIKVLVTMLPVDVIKHKPRGRLFALIESTSQLYRVLVPIKSWLRYLLVSYTGLDIIFGMFFASLYMGAKAFEFIERSKFLRKSISNFLRNVDYGRQPTKDELKDAGTLCPICHDLYDTPVVLECNHVFCEVCVGTWFKREQTCPMCRAKVADDPTWQNGSTSLFYQVC